MKVLTKKDFSSVFCKNNKINLCSLQNSFAVDVSEFKSKDTFLYITEKSLIASTSISKQTLKTLKMKQIKLVDGFWYFKSDLKK